MLESKFETCGIGTLQRIRRCCTGTCLRVAELIWSECQEVIGTQCKLQLVEPQLLHKRELEVVCYLNGFQTHVLGIFLIECATGVVLVGILPCGTGIL